MATATQKSGAARHAASRAGGPSESASLTFLVFEDNGGEYTWTIVGGDGESLARSRPYPTHDDAAQAAGVVREGAALSRFDIRAPRPSSNGPST